MKHILVVSHYFQPETGAPQTRLGELARFWAERGDDVTVLTGFPNHPTGVIPENYRRRIRMSESMDGYRVLRTWLYATPNERVIRKTLGHLSFMVTSFILGLPALHAVDVVICSSPTFFSIFSAWAIARLKRAAFVLEVRDLWPAAIVELGVLRDRRIIGILEALERWCYRRADLIVPVTRGLANDIISRGIPAEKVELITNGVDVQRFEAPADAEHARRMLGAADGELLVLYAGTHGMLYDLETVADAAHAMRHEAVRFAFMGAGVGKRALADRVRELGLHNVTMLEPVPATEIPAFMSAADVCVLPLKDVPMIEMVLAAKMFEYMAAARPVIALLRGESTEVLLAAGSVVLEPGDVTSLVDSLRDLARDPERRTRMGKEAREYVRTHYDRRVLAERYRALLDRVTPQR